MAELDFKKISKDMMLAMKPGLKKHFKAAKEIADSELEDFARRTAELSIKVLEGKIDKEQAKVILKIRQTAIETVLSSIAGIGLLAAQEAMNAALKVLKDVVFKAIPGVRLLV